MRWLRDVGLGVKLSLLLFAVLGVLLLATVLLLRANTENLTNEVGTERIIEEVNIVQRRLSEFERELAVDLSFLSSSVTFFQAVGRRSANDVITMVTQAKDQLGFDDVDVVDGDGAILADVGMSGDEPEVQALLLETLESGAKTVILVEGLENEARVRITASAPVVSVTGNTLGAIQISRFVDAEFLSQLSFDPAGVFSGLIFDGRFLTRSTNVAPLPSSPEILREGVSFDAADIQRAIFGETVFVEDMILSSDGAPHAAAYLPLTTGEQAAPVVMMIAFELDEISSFQNSTLQNTILAFTLIALIMIGVIYAALIQFAIRPITQLRTTANSMIAGNYNQRIPITGHDELGQLATTFNEMALAIQQREVGLQSAREQAERSDQVKSAFLASMSHELRTPLNAILNFTQFVIDGDVGPVNEAQVEMLSEVVTSGKHLLGLINDVLDMSRIEAGSLRLFVEDDVSVTKLLNGVVSTGKSLLSGKMVELHTDIDPNLPLICADAQRVTQIFLNILSNACKFTDTGAISVSAKLQQDDIVVSISDTGPGIAPEDQEVVFDAFGQTKTGLKHGGGTGLGMPIARSLAAAHGGKLWLSSAVGKGTTFYVSLPVKSNLLVPTLAS